MNPPVQIKDSNLVTDWFGYWPSFHDAEVISLFLHRSLNGRNSGACLRVVVYAFKMTSEVTEDGFYKLTHHCVIEFEFKSVAFIDLDGFNHQNALDEIEFSEVLSPNDGASISVVFNPAYGVGLELTCAEISVVSLVPGKPADDLHA